MKPVVAIIGVGILIMLFGGIMAALGNFRGVDYTEPHIVDNGAETTVTIVLANDVLDDSTTNITAASNNADDACVPFLYTPSTRQLVINGLNASDTRTLQITYKVPRLDDFTDLASRYFPAFLVVGCISIVAGVVITAFRRD